MNNWYVRTELLIGQEKIARLQNAHVLIVGMGGVGSFAAEYIARAGVGKITIIDGDTVEATNRNRQLPALVSTEGMPKVAVMAQRIHDINPDIELTALQLYLTDNHWPEILRTRFDYAVDCIDTVTPKLAMIKNCLDHNIRLVSAMGAGGKTDPSRMKIADIAETYQCPFAQYVRKRLKAMNIRSGFKAVFSDEPSDKNALQIVDGMHKKSYYGTISYIPSLFGLYCASVVIRDLAEIDYER